MDKHAEYIALYEENKRQVFQAVRRYCINNGKTYQECEDAVGQAWLVTWQRFDEYKGEKFGAWAYKIAVNTLRWKRKDELYEDWKHHTRGGATWVYDSSLSAEESEEMTLMEFGSLRKGKYSNKVIFLKEKPRPVSKKSQSLYDWLSLLPDQEHQTKEIRPAVETLFKAGGFSPSFHWRDYSFLEVR